MKRWPKLNLTISIVNYNSGTFLLKCLSSISKVLDEARIVTYVIDNASTDNSIKLVRSRFPWVKFIFNKENLGFGKAHNIVLAKLKTKYVLILNPDTVLKKGVIRRMLEFMEENPQVGAASCKVMFPDGRVDLTAHRGFPTPWAAFKYFILKDDSLYHLTHLNLNKVHEVDSISGSFFLTKREVLEKVGLFDEAYFMYAEDIDLCLRIKQAGYKVMYVPFVSIIHYKGVSSGIKKHSQQLSNADLSTKLRALNSFYETMKIFYQKHYASQYPFFINQLIYLGINLKWWMAKRKLIV